MEKMINMKKLKWCAYSLLGLLMLTIMISASGTLLRSKQFVWNLQQMDREKAHAVIIRVYYSQYASIALEVGTELAIERVLTMADDFLDEKIDSLAPQEKTMLDITSSKAFDISGKVIPIPCIVSLVWLMLWQAKLSNTARPRGE